MKRISTALMVLGILAGGIAGASAQSFEVGPGGVRVSPDRGYEDRRGYDRDYDRSRYDEGRRFGPPRDSCARLRQACEYGERGDGNCRRYRQTCG